MSLTFISLRVIETRLGENINIASAVVAATRTLAHHRDLERTANLPYSGRWHSC